MHSFLAWKVFVSSILVCSFLQGQTDSEKPYEDYREKLVLYSDVGYNTAPFNVRFPFSSELEQINYRNNYRTILGIGVAWKWFALRVGIPVFNRYRSNELFTKSDQLNLSADYEYKHWFFEGNLNLTRGYAALNATQWNQNSPSENELFPNLLSYNVSMGTWYFKNKNFKINALLGKRARYLREVKSWYLKGAMNIFGLDNLNHTILPNVFCTPSATRTYAQSIGALDVGLIPGFAYVNAINNWQLSSWFGLGGVIQFKGYTTTTGINRVFLGLAPRYDFRLMGGYTSRDFFAFLVSDFDNKSMAFKNLSFNQYFYSIQLLFGKRFN